MVTKENVFSRCTYDVFAEGAPARQKHIYIFRCGCSPFDALDQIVENHMYGAPTGCDTKVCYRTAVREDLGGKCLVPRSIEYVNCSGEVIFGIYNLEADVQQYSMNYLIEHPELLPDANVENFKSAYAKRS